MMSLIDLIRRAAPQPQTKFQIPRITRRMPLGDYAEELRDITVMVWINPPVRMMSRWETLKLDATRVMVAMSQAEATAAEKKRLEKRLQAIGNEMNAWLAEIWSQGPEETRTTLKEVVKSFDAMKDTDPGLPHWLREKTLQMIEDHRGAEKKV
jgi:hypothetical protein